MERYTEIDLIVNQKDTELRLGLPGNDDEQDKHSCNIGYVVRSNKRSFSPETSVEESICNASNSSTTNIPDQCSVQQPSKLQVVGWPPIRSFRKNSLQQKKVEDGYGMYVKVSMAGAPYLRKIDLKVYKSYSELLIALEHLFKCTFGKNHAGTNNNQLVNFSLCFSISNINLWLIKQVSIQVSMLLPMRTRMVIGCWLEMFHGTCSYPPARS